MRASLRFLVFAALLATQPLAGARQQTGPGGQAGQSAQAPSSQSVSLADAARKAREEKKSAKPPRVYTNDNLPTSGGISSAAASSSAAEKPAGALSASNAASPTSNDEKSWRDKFAKLHQKLDRDKEALDVMQRELGVLNVQYYSDPAKAMQQQYSRDDINKKTAEIEVKKKDVDADQQAISDAEDALQKAGGDTGWAR